MAERSRRGGGDGGVSRAPGLKALVTADWDASALEELSALGEVEYASFRQVMRLLTGSALVAALQGVEVFVTEVDVVDGAALQRLPDLRVIAACRGDAVNVDVDACTAFGVPVLHAPGRNADAVADLTVAYLLMLARKIPEASAFLRCPGGEAGDMSRMGQAFSRFQGRELGGCTVGLVGFGAVGRKVAARLRGFGVRTLIHDPDVADEQIIAAGAESVSLDALLAHSDFVSLHAAVSDSSRGMIGAAALRRMKPGAALINTARAALIDEGALVEALQRGHLSGAALDVFDVEPPSSQHPLLRLDNVIATLHIGGNTVDVARHQGRMIVDDLKRMLRGERPQHVLNPAVLGGFDWSQPRPIVAAPVRTPVSTNAAPAVTDLQKGNGRAWQESAVAAHVGTARATSSETRDGMLRIVTGFVAAARQDRDLRALAVDKNVTLDFVLTDLDLSFWLSLQDGDVGGAVGPPDRRPDVRLKMAAEIFDGMFTGTANPMQAAMDGRLSFSGDTAKAMTIAELQEDLSRLYVKSREEVGDPGILAAPASASASRSASVIQPGDVRHELIEVVDTLYAKQMITSTGGNVSARIPGTPEVWITPGQLFKGGLRPGSLVRIGLDGQPLDADARTPSSERLMHCAVYAVRPEAQAVVHAHAPHATILANARLPFLPISTEAAFFGEIPRVPFIMPGTQELADAIAEAMREGWAVLMENHGVLVAGRSLRRAADMLEVIERSAEIILGCHAVGTKPPVLPEDVVSRMRRMGDMIA